MSAAVERIVRRGIATAAVLLVACGTARGATQGSSVVTIPDNTWVRLTPKSFTASGADVTNIGFPYNDYSGLCYDPEHHGVIVFGGGGHGGNRGNDIWFYDITKNEWRQAYAPDPQTSYPYTTDDAGTTFAVYCQSTDPFTCNPSAVWQPRGTTSAKRPWTSHSYDQMAYDTYNHKYLYFGPNFIFGYNPPYYYGVRDAYQYDVDTKAWTHMASAPDLYHQGSCAEYDPDDKIVVAVGAYNWTQPGYKYLGTPQVYQLNVVTGAWTKKAAPPRGFFDVSMVYDTVNRVMLVYGGDYPATQELWSYNPRTDVWTLLNTLADPIYGRPPAGAPYAAFDSRNGVLLIWGEGDSGVFIPTWAYNVRTTAWKKLNPFGGEPATRAGVGANLAYDPQDNVFLLEIASGSSGTIAGNPVTLGALYAYRYKSTAASGDSIPPAALRDVRVR